MRSQHVTFTERNAVLNKIHEALADVKFHTDQTEILNEIVVLFEENFDGVSPEGGSERQFSWLFLRSPLLLFDLLPQGLAEKVAKLYLPAVRCYCT